MSAVWRRRARMSLAQHDSFLSSLHSDADESQTDESSDEQSTDFDDEEREIGWPDLPDILIVKIYHMLNIKDRYHASMVCRSWYNMFYFPTLWRKLVLNEKTFTHRRYTHGHGAAKTSNLELSNYKVQMCLKKVGRYIRTIQIDPFPEFYNLFNFMLICNQFIEFHKDEYPLESLINFYFTFECECREQNQVRFYGTGGRLLSELHNLLQNLSGLERLKLNNLMLDLAFAPGLMDSVVANNRDTLHCLECRNFTQEVYPLFVAGMFPNLCTLVVSPQQLSPDVLKMLSKTKVRDIHIIQDHRVFDERYNIGPEIWQMISETSPDLRIHLCASGETPLEINFQDGAPVASVTYTTKHSKIAPQSIEFISIMYGLYMKTYGHFGLPRYHGSRSFKNRSDSSLVSLVRTCHHLTTLVIRDRISTATLIIIAREGDSLRNLYVRRNGLIRKCDWQRSLSWTEDAYLSLRHAATDYDRTFCEVRKYLGNNWRPLTDSEFKKITPVYSDNMFSSTNDFLM